MSDDAMDRRKMLRRLIPEVVQQVSEAVEVPVARRRPPGAIEESDFLDKCTRCDDCAEACPEKAIVFLADHVGRAAGTPVMILDERPCVMCEGFPCAAACEPRALEVPEAAVVRLGVVEIDTATCLPFRGPECGACGGLCPEGANDALKLRLGRPSIDAELCIGCGRCIEACITDPKSIRLLPLES